MQVGQLPGRTYAAARANVCNADGIRPIPQCNSAVGSAPPPFPIHRYVHINTCLALKSLVLGESYLHVVEQHTSENFLKTTSRVHTDGRRAVLH